MVKRSLQLKLRKAGIESRSVIASIFNKIWVGSVSDLEANSRMYKIIEPIEDKGLKGPTTMSDSERPRTKSRTLPAKKHPAARLGPRSSAKV